MEVALSKIWKVPYLIRCDRRSVGDSRYDHRLRSSSEISEEVSVFDNVRTRCVVEDNISRVQVATLFIDHEYCGPFVITVGEFGYSPCGV